jgi:hypothetical protein
LDDGAQHLGRGVGDELGVNAPTAFVDTEDGLLVGATAALARAELAAQALRTEVTFVCFDYTYEECLLLLLMRIDQSPKGEEVSIDALAITLQEQRAFARFNVDAKAANNFAYQIIAYLAAFKHLLRLFSLT